MNNNFSKPWNFFKNPKNFYNAAMKNLLLAKIHCGTKKDFKQSFFKNKF